MLEIYLALKTYTNNNRQTIINNKQYIRIEKRKKNSFYNMKKIKPYKIKICKDKG